MIPRRQVMLSQSWLRGVRTWFSRSLRSRTSPRTALRRPRRQKNLQAECVESRCLLSALSISDAAVVEGDAGTTNAVFTITLSAPDTQTVSVTAITSDDTAIGGVDYTPVATLVTFNPGETSKTVTVPVAGDTLAEPNETF